MQGRTRSAGCSGEVREHDGLKVPVAQVGIDDLAERRLRGETRAEAGLPWSNRDCEVRSRECAWPKGALGLNGIG